MAEPGATVATLAATTGVAAGVAPQTLPLAASWPWPLAEVMADHETRVVGATLGAATWQVSHSFELVIGPVEMEGLTRFLPGSRALAELRELVRRYTNDEWQWQLRVLVKRATVPGISLGLHTRLGQVSWVGGSVGLAQDVVLQGDQHV